MKQVVTKNREMKQVVISCAEMQNKFLFWVQKLNTMMQQKLAFYNMAAFYFTFQKAFQEERVKDIQ